MTDPIARKTYYSIGEVSDITGLKPHVLRYWETQFPSLSPNKNRAGNRAYRRKEIKLILLLKHLLYEEKYTIEGAARKLERLRRAEEMEPAAERVLEPEVLAELEEELEDLLELLAPPAELPPPPGDGS